MATKRILGVCQMSITTSILPWLCVGAISTGCSQFLSHSADEASAMVIQDYRSGISKIHARKFRGPAES